MSLVRGFMVRLGISLPALMHLLGHKDIRMTLRYVTVTQVDLQRQFHLARQNAPQIHPIPHLSLPTDASLATPDLPGIARALAATRHLLEMFRRQVTNEKTRRNSNASTNGFSMSPRDWNNSAHPKNEEKLAGQLTGQRGARARPR